MHSARREADAKALAGAMVNSSSSSAGVLEVEYSKVLEQLSGGEELLLEAGVGWKEGLGYRTPAS